MEHKIPTFEFGGHQIGVTIKELPQTLDLTLHTVIGRQQSGVAMQLALEEGVKSPMKVDGKDHVMERKQKDNSVKFVIPPIRDGETRQGLWDKLLRLVVEHNDHLGFVDPFKEVFQPYLPEDDQPDGDGDADVEETNPTPPPEGDVREGSSTDTPSS